MRLCGSVKNVEINLYEETLFVDDIVKQLPPVMETILGRLDLRRTCKKCGTVMEPPIKK